jgi:hypothetical protein
MNLFPALFFVVMLIAIAWITVRFLLEDERG